jgi:hypothetical protein
MLRAPQEKFVFADLDRSDRVLEGFRTRWKQARSDPAHLAWSRAVNSTDLADVKEALSEVRSHLPTGPLFLFRAHSQWCGAVVVRLDQIVDHAFELLELDQEDVIACDEAGSSGLALEYVSDGSRTAHYELFAWLEARRA